MPWTGDEEAALIEELQKDPYASTNLKSVMERRKDVFHPSRTARILEGHHQRLRRGGWLDTEGLYC